LDSSLVAFCARELGRDVRLAVLGMESAPDLAAAREGAGALGLALLETVLTPDRVLADLEGPLKELGEMDEPARSVRLAFALAMDASDTAGIACGQGADELFGGYAHFRGLTVPQATERRRLDLGIALRSEWPWALQRATATHRQLHAPFLDPEVVRCIVYAPASTTLRAEPPKGWLRQAAREHGLSSILADRPKRALQYGSRVRSALPRRGARPPIAPRE
jgi:asparagine synthetase B (glutamine-hydrolysing)